MLITIAVLVNNVQIHYEEEKYKVLLQVVSRSTAMLLERGAKVSFSADESVPGPGQGKRKGKEAVLETRAA
jgi:hypothetical protein